MSQPKRFKTNEDEGLFQINRGTAMDIELRTAILELSNAVSTFANAQNEQNAIIAAQMNDLNRRVELSSSQFVLGYAFQLCLLPIIPNAALYGSQLGNQSWIPSYHFEHNNASQYQHLRGPNPLFYGPNPLLYGPNSLFYGPQMVGLSLINARHFAPGYAYHIRQPPVPNAAVYGPQHGGQPPIIWPHVLPGNEFQQWQLAAQCGAFSGPQQNGQQSSIVPSDIEDMDVD